MVTLLLFFLCVTFCYTEYEKSTRLIPSAACDFYDEGPTDATKGGAEGTVEIRQNTEIEFDFTLNSVSNRYSASTSWECNLIHISILVTEGLKAYFPLIGELGDDDFAVVWYDNNGRQQFETNEYLLNNENNIGITQHVYIKYTSTNLVVLIDDVEVMNEAGDFTNDKYDSNTAHIYLGSGTVWSACDVTFEGFCYKSYDDEPIEPPIPNLCDFYDDGPTDATKGGAEGTVEIYQNTEIEFDFTLNSVSNRYSASTSWECNLIHISILVTEGLKAYFPLIGELGDDDFAVVWYDNNGRKQFETNEYLLNNADNIGITQHVSIKYTSTNLVVLIDGVEVMNEAGDFTNDKYDSNTAHIYLGSGTMWPACDVTFEDFCYKSYNLCMTSNIMHIAFVLDESQSISQYNWDNFIVPFAREVINRDINQGSEISIFSFASDVDTIYKFANQQMPRSLMINALTNQVYDGTNTNTYLALETAINEFKENGYTSESDNNVLFLVTDGKPIGSKMPCDDDILLNLLLTTNIRLVIISIGQFDITNIKCLSNEFIKITDFDQFDFDELEPQILPITCPDGTSSSSSIISYYNYIKKVISSNNILFLAEVSSGLILLCLVLWYIFLKNNNNIGKYVFKSVNNSDESDQDDETDEDEPALQI